MSTMLDLAAMRRRAAARIAADNPANPANRLIEEGAAISQLAGLAGVQQPEGTAAALKIEGNPSLLGAQVGDTCPVDAANAAKWLTAEDGSPISQLAGLATPSRCRPLPDPDPLPPGARALLGWINELGPLDSANLALALGQSVGATIGMALRLVRLGLLRSRGGGWALTRKAEESALFPPEPRR